MMPGGPPLSGASWTGKIPCFYFNKQHREAGATGLTSGDHSEFGLYFHSSIILCFETAKVWGSKEGGQQSQVGNSCGKNYYHHMTVAQLGSQ